MRVLAAMSGGVDSSVAAALMVEEGHEVVGVTLKLWEGPDGGAPTAGCCTVSDAEDARRVAARLDIPYYVLDYTSDFAAGVVDRFIDEYSHGRTPNPCVECNRTVKFDRLLDQATDLGCDLLVTGHYARTRKVGEVWQLWRGADPVKDQSYVLSMLGQSQLGRVRFPVGELTKQQTRAVAEHLGLRNARKPDSQDICFVGSGDYREFLRRSAPQTARPGKIVDVEGRELGRHDGVSGFTIGQRRGLGVALGEPRFVTHIEPRTATVTIGDRHDLQVGGCELESVTWVDRAPAAGQMLGVQVRYRGSPAPATLRRDGAGWYVDFAEPQAGVAPGQAAVAYDGDRVVGGGTIAAAT